MRAPKLLSVVANPYHGDLDHNERPRNAVSVPYDGVSEFYDRRWVGAQPIKDSDGEQYFVFEQYEPNGALKANAEPIKLENGVSQRAVRFRQAIKSGELLAADVETYRAVFGTDKGFLSAADIAKQEQAECLARHLRHGRGAADPKPHSVWTEPLSPEAAQAAFDAAESTARQTPRAKASSPAPTPEGK